MVMSTTTMITSAGDGDDDDDDDDGDDDDVGDDDDDDCDDVVCKVGVLYSWWRCQCSFSRSIETSRVHIKSYKLQQEGQS